ncbi:MAG: Crp/Fnr family transcriptional regulator [Pyrinomonadaceae bacterium]
MTNLNTIITTTNRLLAALPEKDYKHCFEKLERVDLVYRETIYETAALIKHVFFPESGIVSLLSTVEEKSTLEVGIVGSEGMLGLPVFLGVKTSNNLALVQGEGVALRMTTADFLAECANSDEMSRILKRFTHSLMAQTAQSAACNRYHPIEARMARWLLMTHDRMRTGKFEITQEFLSNMVGVRREAVNKAARELQHRGLISYNRGKLLILDLKGLRDVTCDCYEIISKNHPNYDKK